ncbi:hypothetical protein KCP77_02175 [Salmonella enterica subsp. enterica]|nr:hypothetical protein KCP77_02175 [Salmonella enterica subsp. enterica]
MLQAVVPSRHASAGCETAVCGSQNGLWRNYMRTPAYIARAALTGPGTLPVGRTRRVYAAIRHNIIRRARLCQNLLSREEEERSGEARSLQ